MTTRTEVLRSLLSFDAPISELRGRLGHFEWDCGDELANLRPDYLSSVLQRFISGELSVADVEGWADASKAETTFEWTEV
jgi:hypothetical protein